MSKVDAYNPDYYASMSVQPIMVMHACLTKRNLLVIYEGVLSSTRCAGGVKKMLKTPIRRF